MKLLKQISLCLLTAVLSSYTYAEVIELDAVNPDHCRQQILQSTDIMPVIATYSSNQYAGNSKSFMKKFERLAKDHPEKTFYKWDSEQDTGHLTQSLCLQQLGLLVEPNIVLVGVVKDDNSGKMFMSAPIRLNWAGQMSLEEMNKFIDVSDTSIKQAVLEQSNHH